MVKPIISDIIFLGQKSAPATVENIQVVNDLLDTLKAHEKACVGMAANMIGVKKRVIAFEDHGEYKVMLNPEIIQYSGPYEAEEGCLSLSGIRKTKRYQSVKVRFQNTALQERIQTFTGWTAQIIQHEIDHCNGVVI